MLYSIEELVYQASTGKFIGFTDEDEKILATNVLGIYIKGKVPFSKSRLSRCKKSNYSWNHDSKILILEPNMFYNYSILLGITNSAISALIAHIPTISANGCDLTAYVLKAINLLFHVSDLWCNTIIGK